MKGADMQEVFENIIEKLEECKDIMLSPKDSDCFGGECKYNDCTACAFAKAIEIVKQEAEKCNNGWISCSSGVMPRANGWYLVTNHLGVVQEQRWSANHWEKLRDDAVLAWRELPQPYHTKGE